MSIQLKDPSLIRTQSYINGKWIASQSKETFVVKNPLNNDTIAILEAVGASETKQAIEGAHQAFLKWRELSPKERGSYLKKWNELIEKNWDDLSTLLTLETGKPLEQSTHELMGCSGFLEWYSEECKRLHGYTLTSPDPNRRFMTLRQPLGVVGVITPWNFPSVLPIQKCAPALAAGCSVVLKPAEDTPLSALAHAELAKRSGIPEGVFNVVVCRDPSNVGKELTDHPLVRKLTFTGSTQVGKQLISASGKTVKNLCLELGGNCPAIIFEDANLDRAAQATFWFKFYNAGQCCNTINRFFVQDAIYDRFVQTFENLIKKHLKMGSGMDPSTSIGPLINQQSIEKVKNLLEDALAKGANLVCGGKTSSVTPSIYEPTILTQVNSNMRLYREELFSPVAPFYRFKTEEEVIQKANDTNYGLAAYVFTENIRRSWRIAEQFEAGSVGINTCDVCSELLPFGGWKESGIGRENGALESLNDYCEMKSLILSL